MIRRILAGLLALALLTPAYAGFPGGGSGQPRGQCAPGNNNNTLALLHMDGANGGTSFADNNAGGIAATWTASSATTSTTAPKFGTASYLGSATSNARIQSSQNGAYGAGTSDFYVDFWFKAGAGLSTTLQYIAGYGDPSLSTQSGWYIYYDASKNLRFNFQNTSNANAQTTTGVTTIVDGNWHYIMAVKNSSNVQLYIDGVATGTPTGVSGSMQTAGTMQLRIGSVPQTFGTANPLQGNVDEFHYQLGAPLSIVPNSVPYCN